MLPLPPVLRERLPHAHMCTERNVRRMSIRTLAIVILNSRRRRSTREDVWKYSPFWWCWLRRKPELAAKETAAAGSCSLPGLRRPFRRVRGSWSFRVCGGLPRGLAVLERNLYGHPLAGLFWERQFEKVLSEHGWGKVPTWECLFVNREKGRFLSVYVDDIKLAGEKQNISPTWKDVDLGGPTSFLDHVYLGCTH